MIEVAFCDSALFDGLGRVSGTGPSRSSHAPSYRSRNHQSIKAISPIILIAGSWRTPALRSLREDHDACLRAPALARPVARTEVPDQGLMLESEEAIPMGQTRIQGRLAGFLGILIVSALLPACKSPDGSHIRFSDPAPDSTNTVLRPPYQWPETKPLYISGYAGANYDSTVRARPVYSNAVPPASQPPAHDHRRSGAWDSN